MIVILLLIIICIMLFGKEEVKSTIGALLFTLAILALIGSLL